MANKSKVDHDLAMAPTSTDEPCKPLDWYLESFENWLSFESDKYRSRHGRVSTETTLANWKELMPILKSGYAQVKHNVADIITYVGRTMKQAHHSASVSKNTKGKVDRSYYFVCAAALDCLNVLLQNISNEFDKDGFDEAHYETFRAPWLLIMDDLLSRPLTEEVSVANATLDVFAAMGSDIYFQLPDNVQKRLIVYVFGYGSEEYQEQLHTPTKSKIGRCLGKFIQYPSLRDNLVFFLNVFECTVRGIKSPIKDVQISYSWTFGNLTDVILSEYMITPVENMSSGFVTFLLNTGVRCLQVPTKGRYNSCRACGNIFQWLRLEMLDPPYHKELVATITQQLIASVGSGLDYKMRWNSAHALGFALENDIFFQTMPDEVTAPIIKVLSKWVAQSQNYKERAQCAVSLHKAKSRVIYGSGYAHIWDRLFLSLSRLPVDDCDSSEKFKIEAILLLLHLLDVLQMDDVPQISSVVFKYKEGVKSTLNLTVPDIPLERLDVALSCKDNLNRLHARTENQEIILTLNALQEMIESVIE